MKAPARLARGVEMTGDARFAGRVRRLAITSGVALGAIWALAAFTLDAAAAIDLALLAGWLLMPAVLGASLARPGVRPLVSLPSTLVTVALLALCLTALPAHQPQRSGWLLVAAGILLGGALGLWLWFRLLPVPAALDDPYAHGRWALIGVHVGLIVAGLALVAAGETLA